MTSAEEERARAGSGHAASLDVSQPPLSGPPPTEPGGPLISLLFARLMALRTSAPALLAFRASVWSMAGYGVSTVLRFVSRLVLAKLLSDASPMGDVATIVVILAGLEMISDLGIGFNIIQHRRGDQRGFLETAFSVQALRGVGIWAIASLLAAPVAWIYHDKDLTGLLLFGALATLARAFANPAIWVLTRQVDLKGPTILSVASEVAGFIVTIAWCMVSPSAWAIVGGTVMSALVYTAGSHMVAMRVKFAWDGKVARQIAQFGGWMILSSSTYFLASRGETLMLRGSIPDAQFGTFAFASMLVTTPVAAITQLASQVFFPTLASSIREDPQKALRLYKRSKWMFTAVALCFSGGGLILGPPIVKLLGLHGSFVGLEWMVQLLGFRAALDIYGSPTGTVLFASGASRYSALSNVIRLVVLVGGLFVTLKLWGLQGAFVVLMGAPLLAYFTLWPGINKHMPGALRVEALSLVALLAGSALAAGVAWWIAPIVLN